MLEGAVFENMKPCIERRSLSAKRMSLSAGKDPLCKKKSPVGIGGHSIMERGHLCKQEAPAQKKVPH